MKSRWLGALIAGVAGGLWCALYMWPLLNPLSLDVAFREDWAQHSLGWLFFRNETLRFPLGRLRNFLHPLGTTLGYMDAIPWVSLTLRPLSALLPVDFQFLGLWILACSSAMAFFGARICARLTPHWEQQALAGLLFAMMPSLVFRIVHPALCAHAYVVAALGLNLTGAETRAQARRMLVHALLLVGLGSATHPYFAVMVLALAVAVPLRLRRQVGNAVAIAATLVMCGEAALVLKLLGYLDKNVDTAAGGFGMYSANLNTFINSMGRSRLLPTMPTTDGQREGYSYLGVGVFVLAALALGTLALPKRRAQLRALPWRRGIWPLIVSLGMAIFALASPIRWGTQDVIEFDYKPLEYFTNTFRSTGRLIWPLSYLFLLLVVAVLLRAWRDRQLVLSLALGGAVLIQGFDIDFAENRRHFEGQRDQPYAAAEWALAEHSFKHLVLFPVQIISVCEDKSGYHEHFVTELAYLAYRHHWTFNSGYAARVRAATKQYCNDLKRDLRAGQFKPDELYVVADKQLKGMRKAGATCGELDRLHVCVQPSDHPFAKYLAEHP